MGSMSTQELTELRSDTELLMFDICVIQTQAAGSGKNQTGGTWTDGSAIECGVDVDVAPGRSPADTEMFDGSDGTITRPLIRLPIDTSATSVNRIKVTKRHGTTLSTAEIYAILGDPKRTMGELVCNVQFVVGESVR